MSILITGAEGLIGSALSDALSNRGDHVIRFDLRLNKCAICGDIRNPSAVQKAIASCRGIVHLAAVSRVIWGEQDPELCQSTNVGGTWNIIDAALRSARKPWLIYASSREVYGAVDILPATENTPLAPVNIYGRTKAAAEGMVNEARNIGLRAAIVRFSNVYGSVLDHMDRVVPAFARAAVHGERLRVDGPDHTFDFTHIDDTVRGLVRLIDLIDLESPPPPIHFLTGFPCSLGEVAESMVNLSKSKSEIIEAPSRSFDVSQFYGDPSRARSILGWAPQILTDEGFARMIQDFKAEAGATTAGVEVL